MWSLEILDNSKYQRNHSALVQLEPPILETGFASSSPTSLFRTRSNKSSGSTVFWKRMQNFVNEKKKSKGSLCKWAVLRDNWMMPVVFFCVQFPTKSTSPRNFWIPTFYSSSYSYFWPAAPQRCPSFRVALHHPQHILHIIRHPTGIRQSKFLNNVICVSPSTTVVANGWNDEPVIIWATSTFSDCLFRFRVQNLQVVSQIKLVVSLVHDISRYHANVAAISRHQLFGKQIWYPCLGRCNSE